MSEERHSVILLVEDNAANAELATDLLEVAGYRVVQATTAEQALDIARRERPDVILMDIGLPGMDGLSAISALRRDSRIASIPVIALTAQAMSGDREKALAAGCVDYIPKPLDTRAFVATVKRFLPIGEQV
jgi:CheY-like chemotaxis protein